MMTFTLPVGSIVRITQVDDASKKVLVQFDKHLSDWMPATVLYDLEMVSSGIQLDWVDL
jgi:hypothetical protein